MIPQASVVEVLHLAAGPGLTVQTCSRCGRVLVPDLTIARPFPRGATIVDLGGACWQTVNPERRRFCRLRGRPGALDVPAGLLHRHRR